MALSCPLWACAAIAGAMIGRQSSGEIDSMEGRIEGKQTNKQANS